LLERYSCGFHQKPENERIRTERHAQASIFSFCPNPVFVECGGQKRFHSAMSKYFTTKSSVPNRPRFSCPSCAPRYSTQRTFVLLTASFVLESSATSQFADFSLCPKQASAHIPAVTRTAIGVTTFLIDTLPHRFFSIPSRSLDAPRHAPPVWKHTSRENHLNPCHFQRCLIALERLWNVKTNLVEWHVTDLVACNAIAVILPDFWSFSPISDLGDQLTLPSCMALRVFY
jgi:hypothetical protein